MNARRKLLLSVFKLFDVALMVLAFVAASLAALHHSHTVSIGDFFSIRVRIQNFAIFSLFMLLWHIIFTTSGLYRSRRFSNRRSEMRDVITATSVGTLIILAGGIIFRISLTTPLFLAAFWVLATSMTVSSRVILRVLLGSARKRGRNLREVVIVGTNRRALDFATKLASHPEIGCRIAGFVDQEWHGTPTFRRTGHTLVSDFDSFRQFLRNSVVDEVVVALPLRSMHEQSSRIAALCEEQGVTVCVLTNIFDLKVTHSFAGELEGAPLITHSTGWSDGWPTFAKRMLDCIISLILILLLSPIFVMIAILIKLTSSGPVLFVQKRVGLNKRQFVLYKFRTMVVNAEERMREIEHLNEVSGPVFKIKNDPRITPVGRFLRKASLDELPQLFNVLVGNMSLVGPRPLPVRDYKGFSQDWQRRRFSVRPGLTCLWQIRGRSSIPFDKWMELDLQYIDGWSLWLDFQILLRTIPAVLKGLGAA
jgi:exopolysaccharide biosynthesis polyprenyl glycosylphosphotransferase